MKSSSLLIAAFFLGILATTSTTFTTKALAQEFELVNLGCTRNLRTIFSSQAPDYCTSTESNSGILFDQFKVTRNTDRSIKLELKVFNRGSADGLVEVYNSRGNLQDIKIIDGNRPPTGLIQSGTDLFTRVPASLFSRYPLEDSRRNLREQNIIVMIPVGGSVQITKSSFYALRYNTSMLAIEVAQLAKGDPDFAQSNSVKEFIKGFVKDTVFTIDSNTSINIFKSEPTTLMLYSLDFIDKQRLAELLKEIVRYSVTVDSDPAQNPFLGAFSDVATDLGNIAIENIVDKYIAPGLGTFARNVRIQGSRVNTFARAVDTANSFSSGQRATVTFRDKSLLSNSTITSLSANQVKNSTLNIEGDNFKLDNGIYQDPNTHFSIKLTSITLGDLNGDKLQDAVVVFGVNGGGSGLYMRLGFLLNRNGQPIHVKSEELGDRTTVENVRILPDGMVEIEMLPWPSNSMSKRRYHL